MLDFVTQGQHDRTERRQRLKRLGVRLSYWLVVTLAIVVTAPWSLISSTERLAVQNLLFDEFQRWRPRLYADPPPIRIVEIDDESIAEFGRWPWPRARLAEMIEKITGAGAAVVALDILLYDPGDPADDARLAQAMQGRPVVLGQFFTNDGNAPRLPDKAGFAFAGDDPTRFAYAFRGALTPLPAFANAAAGVGFLNWLPDYDRVVRRVPLALGDQRQADAELRDGGFAGGAGRVELHDQILQRERRGELRRPYRHGGDPERRRRRRDRAARRHPHPFRARRPPPAPVGRQAAGPRRRSLRPSPAPSCSSASARNCYTTSSPRRCRPMRPACASTRRSSARSSTNDRLSRPDWAPGAEFLYTVALSLMLAVALPFLSTLGGAAIGLVAATGSAAGSWWAFSRHGLLLDPIMPSLASGAVYRLRRARACSPASRARRARSAPRSAATSRRSWWRSSPPIRRCCGSAARSGA